MTSRLVEDKRPIKVCYEVRTDEDECAIWQIGTNGVEKFELYDEPRLGPWLEITTNGEITHRLPTALIGFQYYRSKEDGSTSSG